MNMTTAKFTVERSKWLRGIGSILSDGELMCCLGFVCLQLGASEADILGIGMPSQITHVAMVTPLLVKTVEGIAKASSLALEAVEINDSPYISDDERERQLVMLFAEHGGMEFVP